jgi:3-oxoacyl-[acyl-carrier protein] reductase
VGRLDGKVAIVTGGARGQGAAEAELFRDEGAEVVITDVLTDVGKVHADAIGATFISHDVRSEEEWTEVVRQTLDAHGRIDVLVNNAGIARDQLMLRMKREDWDAVLATNLTAAFTCAQAVLKPMVKRRGGRIVSVSSVVGQMGNAGQANYAASKAGLIGFSKSLAREVASRNITVNVVAPGLIDTDMTKGVGEKAQAEWSSIIPMQRLGTTGDVAAAICFLASDEAAYITGQVLAVNGGMYM